MSDLHLDFDRDHLPESERENPHASEAFDWESIFASLDSEIQETQRDLPPEEYDRLCDALVKVLAFCVSGRDTQNRGEIALVGARTVALLSVVCPSLVDESQTEMAHSQGVSKQAVNALRSDAAAFIRRLKNARG